MKYNVIDLIISFDNLKFRLFQFLFKFKIHFTF